MCIVKCIFSDQIIFMVHIPFNPTTEGVQNPWVGGGGASEAPPRKSMKELCRTPGCYIELGPIEKLSSHAKNWI